MDLNYIDINLNDEIYISIPIEKDENNIINSIIFKKFWKNPYLNILKFANELEFLVNTNKKKIEIIENSNNNHITKISNNNDENSNHKNLIIILVSIFSLIIIIILVIILYKKCCKKEDQNFYYNINKTSIVVE